MNSLVGKIESLIAPLDPSKFRDPNVTVSGKQRAQVALQQLETLWINTGTLCNIECANCYIESSPQNDRLAYFTLADAVSLFDEIEQLGLKTREIGFTGGEPFMNPQFLAMVETALERGYEVLILTNAMQPMQRQRIKHGLLHLHNRFPGKMALRVSLDHYSQLLHEKERGPNTWNKAITGINWLAEHGFRLAIAGRTCWGEPEDFERKGYAELIAAHMWPIDPSNHYQLMLFPEMDANQDVPEITVACWGILGKRPTDVMCASSRMAVKRNGDDRPSVLPCTLLPYDKKFEMGKTLSEMLGADNGNFSDGAVKLNHPHCSKFCVLGGGSCSA